MTDKQKTIDALKQAILEIEEGDIHHDQVFLEVFRKGIQIVDGVPYIDAEVLDEDIEENILEDSPTKNGFNVLSSSEDDYLSLEDVEAVNLSIAQFWIRRAIYHYSIKIERPS